jgi:FAD/FMN-containing dehydrogenase
VTYNWKYHQAEKKQRLDNGFPNVPQSVFAKLGVTTDVLHAIDKELLGYIILPGMDEYAKFSKGSGMSPFDQGDPLIIFRCEDMQDVWIALRASHDYDWPFVARSGGHSTAGYSSDSQTIIDVTGLNDISLACDDKVSVGPGCTFGKLNRFMKTHKLHIPTGNCDDVRCGGYIQGGGYGYTSRQYGMQIDSVVEFTVILADGQSVTASEEVNPDLFWAMRGGTGGNFGVLVNIIYQAVPMEEIWGFVINYFGDDAPKALKIAQDEFSPEKGLERSRRFNRRP